MRALRELLQPVPRDGILVVHSGFRRLAGAGWRVEGFIEALLDSVSAGTLVMPAMSWRIVTPENPLFDEIETPSHVGIVPELFRNSLCVGAELASNTFRVRRRYSSSHSHCYASSRDNTLRGQ